MSTELGKHIVFGPFRLDQEQELLKSVWAGVYVTKAVVKECMRAIRGALGEDAAAPQYIETVGREGYRFIGAGARSLPAPPTLNPQSHLATVVGRETELAQLQTFLRKALNGERQIVFVTGEPGIGKTTVIDRFREQVQANSNITIGYGQCVEQYGGGEAYLPLLEAMSRLCREEKGQQTLTLLHKHAPTWLVQLPGVLDEAEVQTLRSQVQGATQQRMLREMAEAIEAGTVRRPLVLIMEDLHWSDQATMELLSYLAQRRERACLLVIGTYRPADVVLGNHPLRAIKQELHAKRQCEEIRVELFSTHEISAYLTRRFPQNQFPTELAEEIHQRTEGNALFMVNVVEELLQQDSIVEEHEHWILKGDLSRVNVPDTLRQLIEKQVQQRSDDEQRLMEVASIAGTEFTVAAVAAALKQDLDTVEEVCEDLAGQGHFLEERGIAEWPDGTISGRYSFRHALYQNVLYAHIAEARRVRLHRLIGESEEMGYGNRTGEIATELAVHFERGRDHQKAVQYRREAAAEAAQQAANIEAISHLTRGIELLKFLPDTLERAQQEFLLQATLSSILMTTKGYAAPEVEATCTRVQELYRQLQEPSLFLLVLPTLRGFYFARGELQKARELADQYFSISQNIQAPILLLWAHYGLGEIFLYSGEFSTARVHLEQGSTFYDLQQFRPFFIPTVQDPGVACLTHTALSLWFLGYPAQALSKMREALRLAQELIHPFSLAWGYCNIARLYQLCRERQLTQQWAETATLLCKNEGFPFWLAQSTILRGWALAEGGQEEGIADMCQGFSDWQVTGAELWRSYYLAQLAESYGKVGRVEEGLSVLIEALAAVEKSQIRWYEAELYRLKGELLLQQFKAQGSTFQVEKSPRSKVQSPKSKNTDPHPLPPGPQGEAEACFLKAIDVAQRQQAKSLELRATTSLARLWKQQGKAKQAQKVLSEVYNWFTEGFDTKDLQEAKALLEGLG